MSIGREISQIFSEGRNGMFIIYELYSFDNFFRLLLKNGLDHRESIDFVLANCSLSALVFQERIHNKKYATLLGKDAPSPRMASAKSEFISGLLKIGAGTGES